MDNSRYAAISRDTVLLTVLSLILQALGILFNMRISEESGNAAVGIMSLIFSFFSCIMVLANGNVFVSTSRFVSEEKEGKGNIRRVMRYSITFSLCVSIFFAVISFALSDKLSENVFKSTDFSLTIKILSLALTPAAVGSCIKGYFHGLRKIRIPMNGDIAEFVSKWLCMGFLLLFFKRINFYTVTVISVFFGEFLSAVYYIVKYIKSRRDDTFTEGPPVIQNAGAYMKKNFPIILGGYVSMIMSGANELIVPAMLLKCGDSADAALGQYGMFEAMIIPAVFFPSAVMGSMSNIMLPESAAAMKAGGERPRILVRNAFTKAFSYSFFIAGIFFSFGKSIGTLICPSDTLVGESLCILAPVIPFIYLEIILEGMLKGMGQQNFCTVNSLCEYVVRIGCVIVFVPVCGFWGVIVSYYASNCLSNISRIIKVLKTAGARFYFSDYIGKPVIISVLCAAAGVFTGKILPAENGLLPLSAKLLSCALVYFILTSADKKWSLQGILNKAHKYRDSTS